jgi:hypothetical protein
MTVRESPVIFFTVPAMMIQLTGFVRRRIQFNPSIAASFFFDHLITQSDRASTFGGIVRPICFAAFRLIDQLKLRRRPPA